MKKIFLLVIGASIFLSTTTFAQRTRADGGPFGAGVILGAPTGLVGKYWMAPDRAVDMGLAFFFGDLFLLYADYLVHFPRAFASSDPFVSHLSPYIGIGGMMLFWGSHTNRHYYDSTNSVGLGVRVPLGIEWKPGDPPLGVFVELVPGVGIIPGTFGFVQGGIGIRYYF
jgi:hypothetical protein